MIILKFTLEDIVNQWFEKRLPAPGTFLSVDIQIDPLPNRGVDKIIAWFMYESKAIIEPVKFLRLYTGFEFEDLKDSDIFLGTVTDSDGYVNHIFMRKVNNV